MTSYAQYLRDKGPLLFLTGSQKTASAKWRKRDGGGTVWSGWSAAGTVWSGWSGEPPRYNYYLPECLHLDEIALPCRTMSTCTKVEPAAGRARSRAGDQRKGSVAVKCTPPL